MLAELQRQHQEQKLKLLTKGKHAQKIYWDPNNGPRDSRFFKLTTSQLFQGDRYTPDECYSRSNKKKPKELLKYPV